MSNIDPATRTIQLPDGRVLNQAEWGEALRREEAEMNRLNLESIAKHNRATNKEN